MMGKIAARISGNDMMRSNRSSAAASSGERATTRGAFAPSLTHSS
jgi:hypothetical protein